ncbi:protein-disulfide reductase DsbD family protein [Niabella yanshanensis]|uniref:Protein-disulfide reductase DsbD family protein n=1 Tax=Niabella yanshanensis TaxID=577386 RepID=A0ABZ0W6N3_9BACT|nr:protein-disulfide reductase DsbD domain-containing protein [Niabella yanshanensis]WQD38958.1 protein-disulfide reductase DsbD family protein [Niabella yanshanensis]
MRHLFLTVVAFASTLLCFSQVKQPAKWSFSAKKINATTYEIHLMASLEGGWHIYSQTTPAGGPVATKLKFTPNPLITVEGVSKEIGKLEKKHEAIFGIDVKQFSNTVDFVQVVKLKGKVKTNITGSIDYMTCNDRECLPPTQQKFSIALQ